MRTVLATLFVLVCAASFSVGQTNVGGTINKDSTWTLAGSPYIVTSNLTMNSPFVLRVDSGVVVRFQASTGLYVRGSLVARHAKFTSSKDTVGGVPVRGDWNFIQIGDGSFAGTATIDTCVVKWGGYQYVGYDYALLYVYNGSLALRGSDISSSRNYGVGVLANGSATIQNSNISQCEWPLGYFGQGAMIFTGGNNFTGNTHDGAYMSFSTLTSGTLFLDTLAIPYVFPYFTVNSGATLEIASNNMLKFTFGGGLNINGTLIAKASAGQQTRFTSYTDDNVGGNTDAATVTTVHSYWYGIIFNNTSVDTASILKRCRISYAGYSQQGGVTLYNASPTIDSCSFATNYYGVMMQGTSSPVFSNNDIATSYVVPIALSFSANPVFSNNTFSTSDNQYNAIGILSETIVANSFLPVRSFTSIPNVTYLLLGEVTVPAAYTLTIQPGVVIKAYYAYHRLIVKGKLVAQGNADSTIVFTSVHDDQYGNPFDTNKNGNITNPARGDWGGITFESTSDPTSILRYCVLRYGNTPGTYYGIYPNGAYTQGLITLIDASPTIENDTLTDNVYGIYAFYNSNPTINNCTFVNTQYTPVAMSVSANPTFLGSNVMQNPGLRALGIIGHNVISNGTVYQRNFAGFTNITYVVLEDVTVNLGTVVTVQPGVVIKMNPNTGIYVNGGFVAKGDMANGRISFTSTKDDNLGNPLDTNGDGLATSPAQGNWYTIRFQDTSVDTSCVLDSTDVLYGGNASYGAVTFLNASGSVKNSVLAHSNYYGVRCDGNSAPLVSDVTIQDSRLDPIAMSLLSNPTLQNIIFDANGTKGIRILEGTLSSNATLNKRDVAGITNIAYLVDNLTINPGATLTIAPGVVIKFSLYYYGISVQGGLIANGTPSQRIIFTSLYDDSNGGDTNNDGSTSSPNKGNWNSIDFTNSSIDTINSLKNCDFRYGGGYQYSDEYGIVRIYSSRVLIDSCAFTLGYTSGIGIFGSADPTVARTEINAVNYTPVTMSMFATPTFINNTFLNVGYAAIGIKTETYSQNSTIPLRDFGGYTNITYVLWGNITVNSGTVITIPAGAVFKDYGFYVNGSLKVLGTLGNPVVFTHSRDDSYGNPMDTNGDGSATSPSTNASYRIYFNDQSVDTANTVQNAVLRYATYAIDLQQAAPTVSNSLFSRNDWGLRLSGVSGPTVDNCTFDQLDDAPILMSLAANFTPTGTNVISGTTYRAIGIVNETLAGDATMTKRNFAGVNNIPYLVSGLTVGTSSTLTIEPGVIVKFRQYSSMTIQRGLLALGKLHPDSTVVFTAETDDFYGGDTNADSTATSPYVSYWGGINFDDLSYDPDCRIEHAAIRYGGYSGNGAVRMTSASPTLLYVSFRDNYTGVRMTAASNPVINYCDIYKNTNYGIENVNQTFVINATNNWWGSNNGPTHSGNPGGTGSTVTNGVNYTPYRSTGTERPLAGDVSLSGTIQAYDASLILKYLADGVANPLNSLQQQVADVSGVGGITAMDGSLILQYVVGKISIFPIEFNRSIVGNFGGTSAALGSIGLTNSAVERGKQVTITVTANAVSGLYAAGMEISFDRNVMKAVSVEPAVLTQGKLMEYGIGEGRVRIFFASADPVAGSGELLKITFEASNDLRGNVQSPVRFTQLSLNELDALSQAEEGVLNVKGKPLTFAVKQNYPNPFNPSTTIGFDVPNDGDHVRLEVFNLNGQLIRVLVDKDYAAGEHQVTWDGRTERGERLGSGLYFYRIKSGTNVSVRKMVMVK